MPKETKTVTVEVPAGPAPVFTEQLPSAPGGISAIASANAPFVFFDEVPFRGHSYGAGMLTLTAARFLKLQPDGSAPADHVVVAHLRATLPALVKLRNAIDRIIEQAASAAPEPAPAEPEPAPTAH